MVASEQNEFHSVGESLIAHFPIEATSLMTILILL